MDNNYYSQSTFKETKCPGKEIAGLVLGINSLVWGIFSALFGVMPYVGFIYSFIWGGFGIGMGIAALVLHKRVHEEATYITNKIETGKKLGLAGLIVSIAGIVLSIVVGIVILAVFGTSLLSNYN